MKTQNTHSLTHSSLTPSFTPLSNSNSNLFPRAGVLHFLNQMKKLMGRTNTHKARNEDKQMRMICVTETKMKNNFKAIDLGRKNHFHSPEQH